MINEEILSDENENEFFELFKFIKVSDPVLLLFKKTLPDAELIFKLELVSRPIILLLVIPVESNNGLKGAEVSASEKPISPSPSLNEKTNFIKESFPSLCKK